VGGPLTHLEGYRGYLQTDGYSAYQELLVREGIAGVGCWVHARRYFVKAHPSGQLASEWMLERIGELYETEREARSMGLDAVTPAASGAVMGRDTGLVGPAAAGGVAAPGAGQGGW